MDIFILAETAPVDLGWILGSILTLGGVISILAQIIYKSQQKQIDKLNAEVVTIRTSREKTTETLGQQSLIIAKQSTNIGQLQKKVRSLSKGCGATGCVWVRPASPCQQEDC